MSKAKFSIGDYVFWATASAAGEYLVIGYLKDAPDVLVFDNWGEVDAKDCVPTGRSDPKRAREARLKYFRNFPGKLQGNPQHPLLPSN